MADNQIKTRTVSNLFWRFAERCGAQGVAFIVSIILARLLDPEAYGTVALLTVFTSILQVFVDSGLGNALIQKKDADQLDFSSVFLFNMGMCLVLYILLYVASPLIAFFYNDPSLTPMMRVLGLTIVISGFKNIQQAYVSKHLMFKKFFFSTLGGTIIAAVVGIAMAYNGFGAWAIVAQQVVNTAIDTMILFATVKWRPHIQFSYPRFKKLFSYGWKLLVSGLLDTVYNDLRQLIIGKLYTSSDLAYYNKGKQFPNFVINNINNAIDSVLLPVMSAAQDDESSLKRMTRHSIKTSTYVMAPIMMGMAFTSNVFIPLLLTDKWNPCIPYLRVFCIVYMFRPIHTANLNAIRAMGRSDLILQLEVKKKIVGLASIFAAVWWGPMAMAYSFLVTSILNQMINAGPNKKLLDYGYLEQLKDILPSLFLAIFMGFCTIPISLIGMTNLATFVLQVIVGAIVYIGGSVLLKMESFYFIWDILKPMIKRQFKKKNG
ncbi:MAG: lipopolysaccharide biosynthesis protein [Lachnospiraceae bacterium]|nr:lipopolysaccharide biosynthesis protein [Lachnospiraceae bacterium]